MPLKFGIIKQTQQFNASPEDVFNALLDPQRQSEFTGSPATTSHTLGARFTAWDGYISGKNLKLVKNKRIVQEWKTIEWPKNYGPSRLEFTVTPKKGGTQLTMVHSKVPAEQVEDYRKSWHTSCWTPMREYFAKKSRNHGENTTGVIDRLATSLRRRDEAQNVELAKRLADTDDKKAVAELVDNLTNIHKNIQSDCIKVLYEIGERKPALIAEYAKEFVGLLNSKNNRLVWGAMTALDTITLENPEAINSALSKILETADKGSVITKDHAVSILIKLVSNREYRGRAIGLLIEQLKRSPTNQLPMYAEKALPIINDENKSVFKKTLTSRLNSIEKQTKRKRIEKIIDKLS